MLSKYDAEVSRKCWGCVQGAELLGPNSPDLCKMHGRGLTQMRWPGSRPERRSFLSRGIGPNRGDGWQRQLGSRQQIGGEEWDVC